MDYINIYREHAVEYDRLVNAEDCDQRLLPALQQVCPLSGASVLEVGAGTGRVSRLLAGKVARFVGSDLSPAMLAIARAHLGSSAALAQADGRQIPVASGWADLAVAGWVFGHLTGWFAERWQTEIGRGLDEMARALKPGGALVIIETLGTGFTEPRPPNTDLAAYYVWMENVRGFQREILRTDYCFSDVEQAAEVTGFFFGDSFAERVRRERWTRVPECTGLWWKRA